MLHYFHQLVANFVCLLFDAKQEVYSVVLVMFHWKQLPSSTGREVEENGETEPKQ